MPVQKKIDSNIELNEDDLDKAIADAEKLIDKRLKNLQRTKRKISKVTKAAAAAEKRRRMFGGVPASDEDGLLPESRTLPKGYKENVKNVDKSSTAGLGYGEKSDTNFVTKAILKDKNILDKMFAERFGTDKFHYLGDFLRSPQSALIGTLEKYILPLLIANSVKKSIEALFVELQKPSGILDRWYEDKISNRTNPYIDKELQADIIAGFANVIITDESGYSSTVHSSNSYENRETNKNQHEDDWIVRYAGNY